MNVCAITYNVAVMEASFPSVVMVKSCSLLSVILVGVFCSKVRDKKLKLGPGKVFIGLVAAIGIFFFNYFGKVSQDEDNKPINYLSSLILIVSLIGDGFLPDFQTEVKSLYKPSPYMLYYEFNKATCLISFSLSILTLRIFGIYEFAINHPAWIIDMVFLSFLNSMGQIFVYQLLKHFQQHIPAFVIAIRKCLTVVINLIWFHHDVNQYQLYGILFVLFAIAGEIYMNNFMKNTPPVPYVEIRSESHEENVLITEDEIILKDNEKGENS